MSESFVAKKPRSFVIGSSTGLWLLTALACLSDNVQQVENNNSAPAILSQTKTNFEILYHIETVPAKRIRATMSETQFAPKLEADLWGVLAGCPPECEAQNSVKASLRSIDSPQARTVRINDKSPLRQKVFFLSYPPATENQKHTVTVEAVYELTLMSRRLVRGSPATAITPLNHVERAAFLLSAGDADYATTTFRSWLCANGLLRRDGELDLDFARRSFAFIAQRFHYNWVPGSPSKASQVCLQGWSHCGPLSGLFVATMRANGIPARVLVGRWAASSGPPEDRFRDRDHVKAEFFAQSIGWVPVDISSALTQHNVNANFGHDNGDFIVMNFDFLAFDDVPRAFQNVQCPWLFGKYHGSWDGWTDTRDLKVVTLSLADASPK